MRGPAPARERLERRLQVLSTRASSSPVKSQYLTLSSYDPWQKMWREVDVAGVNMGEFRAPAS